MEIQVLNKEDIREIQSVLVGMELSAPKKQKKKAAAAIHKELAQITSSLNLRSGIRVKGRATNKPSGI